MDYLLNKVLLKFHAFAYSGTLVRSCICSKYASNKIQNASINQHEQKRIPIPQMHPTVWLPWENKIREMRMSPRKTNSGCNFFLCRGMHLILSRTTNHYVRRTAISCASSNIFPVSIQHYGDINCTIIFIPVYRLLFLYDDAFATPILRAQYVLCYIKHKLILFT